MNFAADLSSLYKETPVEQVWGSIRLTKGFSNLKQINLKEIPLQEVLSFLGEGLNFLDHVRVAKCIKLALPDFDTDEYFKAVNYHHTSYLLKSLELISILPKSFIDWATEKNISPKDFRVFFGVDLNDELLRFIDASLQTKPSKSEGLLIFEYALDLYFSKSLDEKFYNFKDASKLLSALKKKRFLKTFESDELVESKISKIDFGSDSKLKTMRDGDKRLLFLEVKSTHPLKLKTAIERISQNITKIEDAWN